MDDLEIKNQLLEQVQSKLQTKILELKKAMDDAQQEANAHIGAMASRYDTFKQEAQALRDGFALQVQRTSESLAVVQQFAARQPESKRSDKVEFGAAVITNEEASLVLDRVAAGPGGSGWRRVRVCRAKRSANRKATEGWNRRHRRSRGQEAHRPASLLATREEDRLRFSKRALAPARLHKPDTELVQVALASDGANVEAA